MSSTLEQALRLARRGLPVFPCRAEDKRPVHRGGFLNAAATPEDVLLFCWDASRLIGVPTGAASGIAVLDVDPRHGGDAWLEANKRRLPYTRAHQTRSGGIHLLFRWPDGLRNSAGQIAPGIDVRGEGGYVIWWPAHGCMVIDHLPLAELPPWPAWIDLPARQRGFGGGRGPRVGDPRQVSALSNFVRESRGGERNSRLFWAACRLAEMRFERAGHRHGAAERLLGAAVAVGLPPEEAEATIASALNR